MRNKYEKLFRITEFLIHDLVPITNKLAFSIFIWIYVRLAPRKPSLVDFFHFIIVRNRRWKQQIWRKQKNKFRAFRLWKRDHVKRTIFSVIFSWFPRYIQFAKRMYWRAAKICSQWKWDKQNKSQAARLRNMWILNRAYSILTCILYTQVIEELSTKSKLECNRAAAAALYRHSFRRARTVYMNTPISCAFIQSIRVFAHEQSKPNWHCSNKCVCMRASEQRERMPYRCYNERTHRAVPKTQNN